MKSKILIPLAATFFIFCLHTRAQAQIEAPNLVCIDNDTLVWETPMNDCGAFLGYIIMGSQIEAGPYTPIDTIQDQAETTYFHQDAGGSTWYYYMESDFDCPGLSRMASDTLDNRIPEIGPLQSVSVVGLNVELNWLPSPSPETAGYIISRNSSSGTMIIDTVFGETSYTDATSAPYSQIETYFVTAIDRCGNTSLVDAPHSTMLMEIGEVSECDQTIRFSWTPYEGWANGPEKYNIWYYRESSAFELAGTVGGTTTSFLFENADDGIEYCFRIEAVETEGGNSSFSNISCVFTSVVQPIRELSIQNVSFNENDNVVVSWRWNNNAQLTGATLTRSVDGGSFEPIHNIDITNLMTENIFIDASVPNTKEPVCYRIETVDECGAQTSSDIACTLNLTTLSDGQGSNQISWTPFDFGQPSSLSYELSRVVGGAAQSISTLGGNETSFLDEVDLSDNTSGTICYYVVANAEVLLPDGSISQVISRSNISCTEQSSAIYIPNAFAPTGVNTEFRAYLQFGAPAEFLLEVYDRWGNKVFQGQSIDQAWDGTKNGQDLPAGVYIYRLVLTQSNGGVIEQAGSVALIR